MTSHRLASLVVVLTQSKRSDFKTHIKEDMNMRRRLRPKLVAGLSLLAVGLVGVTTQATAAGRSSNPLTGFKLASYIQQDVSSGKKLNFVYITNDLASSYTAAQKAGVVKAAKVLGVNATLQGPPTGAAQDQVNLIQTLVTQQKVDGIVVAAVNVDSLKPVIQAAYSAGIPLISAFTDQADSKQLAFIGEDNHAFGVYRGEASREAPRG